MSEPRDSKHGPAETKPKEPSRERSKADDEADNPDYRGPDPQSGRGTPSQAEGDRDLDNA